MTRNLLFISKYKEFNEEFLDAMRDKNIAIDTAQTGIEAVALLKKREYQVIVTGIVLDGYNGEQLITYINKAFPNTVCIICTKAISAAQLHFFVNKRNVFRVFLRPLDIETEFMEALEEAYEYYGVKVKDREEQVRQEKLRETYQNNITKMNQKIENDAYLRHKMADYIKRLAMLTLKEYATDISEEGQKRLKSFEMGMVELCCRGGYQQEENLDKAEEAVVHIAEIVKM